MAILVTPRDLEILASLEKSPLTVRQLLAISECYLHPFSSERCVRERMATLCKAKLANKWIYATHGHSSFGFYVLTKTGYQLLHGPDAIPRKRLGAAVSLARQTHTQYLADVVVQTCIAASRAQADVVEFHPENVLRLTLGDECLYPDSSFRLLSNDGRLLTFFIELDNGTQAVTSPKDLESWQKKINFYERYMDQGIERFRVLIFSTKNAGRLSHILSTAASLARVPARSLCLGTTVRTYLASESPFTDACFLNHRQEYVSLLQHTGHTHLSSEASVSSQESAMILSIPCR